MTTDQIRVDYRRSGGVAGIDMTAGARSDELSADDARVAADLLGGTVGSSVATATSMPDGFTYEVRVTDGSTTRTHRWSQSQIPDVVRPLIDTLAKRASPGS